MNIADLVVAAGSLLSGVRILAEGLSEMDRGRRQLAGQFKGDGTEARGTLHKVGNRIEERIDRIRDLVRKGAVDPKIRSYAVKVVSSRCARCRSCKTPNILTAAEGGGAAVRPGSCRAVLQGDSLWRCGRCRRSNDIASTEWCVPEKDARREVEAVFAAVRANVRYVRDVHGIDTFQHPKRTLAWGGGDCDDYTVVLGSMLMSIGYPVRARVMETKDPHTGRPAGGWSHILLMCGLPPRKPTGWLPLDASLDRPAGWYPPKALVHRTKDFRL